MGKLKLKMSSDIGDILTREELKRVFGGTGSGSGSGTTICSATCTGSSSISLNCDGTCEAVADNYVKCTDEKGMTYAKCSFKKE